MVSDMGDYLRRYPALFWVILFIIGLGVYSPGFGGKHYADDFQRVFVSPGSKIFYYFSHYIPYNNFYRPIQASFLSAVQALFGMNTVSVHFVQLTLHSLLCFLIYAFMLKTGFSRLQAVLGSLFMMLSQANAFAILSNDTFSQVSGTLFCCLGVWSIYKAYFETAAHGQSANKGSVRKYYILAIILFVLSLLSKESSVSFIPMLLFLILIKNYALGSWGARLKRSFIEILPFLFVLFAYYLVRSSIIEAHDVLGSRRYQIHIGANIIKNLFLTLTAASLPFSTVTVFVAAKIRDFAGLAAIMGSFLFFLGLIVYGLYRSEKGRLIIIVSVLGIISLFPMILLNHVSELYAYNCMPFVSILAGCALGTLYQMVRPRRGLKLVWYFLVIILFFNHVFAVEKKASMMKANGERAAILLDQIIPHAQRLPENGELWLLNPPGTGYEYSIYILEGFNYLNTGLNSIQQLSGRNDVTARIVSAADVAGLSAEESRLILTLEGETVRIYHPPQ